MLFFAVDGVARGGWNLGGHRSFISTTLSVDPVVYELAQESRITLVAEVQRLGYEGDMLTESETLQLLNTLCVRLGFCLPPAEHQRLCESPPDSVKAFTDAVFKAEGMDPDFADRHLYRQVRDLVRETWESR